MPVRVAINGFGRTGRAMFRAAHEQGADIEWAGINDIMGVDAVARLLAKDSVYGRFPGTVEALDGAIRVDGREIPVFAEPDPGALPWRERGRRGRDRVERALPRACRRRPPPRRRRAQGDHLGPGQGAGRDGRARHQLRRRLRPRPPPRHLQRLLHDELPRAGGQGAARGVRDPARRDDDRPRVHGRPAAARRAAQGPAARPRRRAQPRPDHDRRRQGDRPRRSRSSRAGCRATPSASRPPRSRWSTSRSRPSGPTTVEAVNAAVRDRADTGSLAGILAYSEDALVSTDLVGSPYSSIFDAGLTTVVDGTQVKVVAWYDNEWGYSSRLVELAQRVLVPVPAGTVSERFTSSSASASTSSSTRSRGAGTPWSARRSRDGAIVYDELRSAADLPVGWTDEQDGGHYRLAPPRRRGAVRLRRRAALVEAVPAAAGRAAVARPPRRGRQPDRDRGAAAGATSLRVPRRALLRAARDGHPRPRLLAATADRATRRVRRRGQLRPGGRHVLLRLDGHRPEGRRRLRPRADRGARGRPPLLPRRGRERRGRRGARRAGARRAAGRRRRARPSAPPSGRRAQMGREMDVDGHQGAALPQPRAPALGRGRRPLPDLRQLHDGLPDLLLHDGRGRRPTSTGEHVERHQRWDSCFTVDYSHIHGGSVRTLGALALPPVDDPQARHLDRPVRQLGLRRLRPLHHLVPGRHRHHRGGRARSGATERGAMRTID